MAARITRAKKKIAAARIPYRVPGAEELPARIDAVLSVVHLVFTTGHTAPAGERLVRQRPGRASARPRPHAALAVELGPRGRRPARADPAHQRAQRHARVGGGRAAAARRPGPLALGRRGDRRRRRAGARSAAAPATRPLRADGRDRRRARRGAELRGDRLARGRRPLRPAQRGLAIPGRRAEPRRSDRPRRRAEAGLRALDALADEPQLATYRYLAAARADFLRQLGRIAEARSAYEEALLLSENAVERAFLAGRLEELSAARGAPG